MNKKGFILIDFLVTLVTIPVLAVISVIDTSFIANDVVKKEPNNITNTTDVIKKEEKEVKSRKVKTSRKSDKTFENVEIMKKVTDIKLGEVLSTNGFYKANDGGEAYYKAIDNKTLESEKLTVDEAYVIKLKNNLYARLIVENETSVKQFGARGDGITDDSSIINTAFKYSQGHTLYVPKGTYILGSKVYTVSNITVVGDGKSSVFMAKEGTPISSDLFVTRNKTNVTFKNIAISGNSSVNNKEKGHSDQDGIHLFDIWDSSNITIENCYFIDNIYAGIRIIGGRKIHIRNSNFLNIDCGVITLGSADNDDLVIENNLFDGHQNSEPVSIYGTGKTTNVTINNNTFKNKKYGSAIYAGKGTINNIKITNNKISGVATGIVLHANNAVIKNNTIDNSSTLDSGGHGITISGSSNVEVFNNNIRKTCQNGIRIAESTNVDIHDNTITDAGYANNDFFFVNVRGGNKDVNFYNNALIRKDETLSKVIIMAIGKQDNVKIINNKIQNGTIHLYVDSENYIVKNNGVPVTNRGHNNIVED